MSSELEQASSASAPKLKSRPVAASLIIIGGLIALALGMAASIAFGAKQIPLSMVWESLTHFNPDSSEHQIIHELRMPRALAAALVGAGFAVAGAIMQGMTRNPLADSGLLGINAGAAFAMVLCFAFLKGLPFLYLMFFSLAGAAFGAGLVFGISSLARGGLSPVRLALAGAAVSALLVALGEGISIHYNIGQDLAFFYAGGVAGAKWIHIKVVLPWVIAALLGAMALSRSITLLSLGDDIATGLGQRTRLVKIIGMIFVFVLAGAAVSLVGSIGFVGLIIPHLTRFLVGVDYRWVIPCSAILGSLLMVTADLSARLVNPPAETPVGALIAVIGVPFFLYLARKQRREM
ncbi:FecCD family ABC transporter permease [Paenibacillus sp. SYP-B4298]|uniref:FecCD family ABC transporter permease n=1 Tax=Paenibacillus sp. SYP-B4298 TaxID=2996034 RepID=UPI0022DCE60B|nr:iron ABC transporter permease [Paenibacillus sp. SYP-B4298]